MSDEVKRGRKAETLPVRLKAAYWPKDGSGRQDEGAEIELPADEARELVKQGLASRNDAF